MSRPARRSFIGVRCRPVLPYHPGVVRLAIALFAIQAGFHAFTAVLPLALADGGVPDPEIGLVVGSAALVQVPAAFAAGALLDRFGGTRLLGLATVAYVGGALLLLLPGVEPGGPRLPFFGARILQGVGIAAALPAALALVPRLVPAERRGFGLAFIGAAHNLTLVALPPLSLAILAIGGMDGVGLLAIAMCVVGLAIARTIVLRPAPAIGGTDPSGAGLRPAHRRLGFAFRRSWLSILAIILLYVAHWGVVVAYLPQRADAAGADIGLFFAADGIAILLARVPTGSLADRVQARWLVLAGVLLTGVSLGLLLLPPTTPLLILAGVIGGAGGGLVLSPLLLEISRRSDDADRGSAFALFSAALAGALSLGSVGGAPIVGLAGFEAAIGAGIVALGAAALVSVADGRLAQRPRPQPELA